jgi:hypothetical protein
MNHPTNPTTGTIEVTVGPKGETTVRTLGFAGPSCRQASRFVEEALGERAAETLTAEFYQPQAAAEQVKQGG